MANIGIIGAGISGLTLASVLKSSGYQVRVFERGRQPGGAMKTSCSPDGWISEWGPNTIVESSGRIQKLIALAGLEQARIYPSSLAKKRYIVKNGQAMAVPDSLPRLLRTSLLSRSAKWRLFKEPFLRRGRDTDQETVAGFVRRRLGEEFLKWPIDALVGGIYAGDPEKLSLKYAFPRLSLLEKQHGSLLIGQIKGGVRRPPGSDEIPRDKAPIFSFEKGMQMLPDALADQLGDAIHYSHPVHSVACEHPSSGNQPVWIIRSPNDDTKWTFDAIVYAGNAWNIKQTSFPDAIQREIGLLETIPHPPVSTITLGYRKKDIQHPLDGFGMLIPGIESFPILGTLFTSSLFPNRAPDTDHVTLTTYLGGMRQPEVALKEESDQIGLVHKSLTQLLGAKKEPVFSSFIFHQHAIPQYHSEIGHVFETLTQLEANHPGLFFCGNYRSGISVGDSINAAFDLASNIITKIPLSS